MMLPPVDKHTEKLIEPFGHLVIVSTRAEHSLIELLALLQAEGPDTAESQVAHKLRNWDGNYVRGAILSAVDNDIWSATAIVLVERLEALREKRHRIMHDAVEHGIFEDTLGGFQVGLLQVGFVRRDKHQTDLRVVEITPEEIAALAMDFYNLGEAMKDLWAELQRL